MYRYAQINLKTGHVVSDSFLSGQVESENLIPIPDHFDLTGKMYVDGAWVDYAPEPAEPGNEATDQDAISAEILLNQAQILSNQNAEDEVLAEILLNQMGG